MPPSSFADYIAFFVLDGRDKVALDRWFASLPPTVDEHEEPDWQVRRDHYQQVERARRELERLAILHVEHALTTSVLRAIGYTSPHYDCDPYLRYLCGGRVPREMLTVAVRVCEPSERPTLVNTMKEILRADIPEDERSGLYAAMQVVEGASESAILVAWDEQDG